MRQIYIDKDLLITKLSKMKYKERKERERVK